MFHRQNLLSKPLLPQRSCHKHSPSCTPSRPSATAPSLSSVSLEHRVGQQGSLGTDLFGPHFGALPAPLCTILASAQFPRETRLQLGSASAHVGVHGGRGCARGTWACTGTWVPHTLHLPSRLLLARRPSVQSMKPPKCPRWGPEWSRAPVPGCPLSRGSLGSNAPGGDAGPTPLRMLRAAPPAPALGPGWGCSAPGRIWSGLPRAPCVAGGGLSPG